MKTKLTIIILFITSMAFADDTKYLKMMAQSIESLYKSGTPEEYQQSINTFDRIGNAEKTKWEPFYYSAFGYLMMANKESDVTKKDQWLDKASEAVAKASAINPAESEIIALDGFTQLLRVTVDPASRGARYTGQAGALLGKAISLNPENPRALSLMAQMQLGTARFFKSPTTEGCATAAKALEKFDSYKSPNPMAPVWGREMTEGLVKACQ